jgi:hypothetical protein
MVQNAERAVVQSKQEHSAPAADEGAKGEYKEEVGRVKGDTEQIPAVKQLLKPRWRPSQDFRSTLSHPVEGVINNCHSLFKVQN